MGLHESASTSKDSSAAAPLLDEAGTEQFPTWVASTMFPQGREEAPTLDQLCTELIAALDASKASEAPAADDKPLRKGPTEKTQAPTNGVHSKTTPPNPTQQPSPPPEAATGTISHPFPPSPPPTPSAPRPLNALLTTLSPSFTTYTDLAALAAHPSPQAQALAARIRAIFLAWMDAERVPATWVTRNILLDGLPGALDAATLRALCAAGPFPRGVALLSIHPDDWAVGGAWRAHGRLPWVRRPAGAADRAAHGVAERLVAPLWDEDEHHEHEHEHKHADHETPARQRPGTIVQAGVPLRSPVVDHLVVPLEDGAGASLLAPLPDICTFIAAHSATPGVLVVVHCKMGLSRSSAAVEAFVLQAVARRLRLRDEGGEGEEEVVEEEEDRPTPPTTTTTTATTAPTTTAREAQRADDLLAVQRRYHAALARRRPDLKDKFPRQLASWARHLAAGAPAAAGPRAATDASAAAGGEGMRDAAVVACYQAGWLLPASLVAHYHKRTGAAGAKGPVENTVRRFREAEGRLRAEDGGEKAGKPPWVPLRQFVELCEAAHWSRSLGADVEGQ